MKTGAMIVLTGLVVYGPIGNWEYIHVAAAAPLLSGVDEARATGICLPPVSVSCRAQTAQSTTLLCRSPNRSVEQQHRYLVS